MHSDLFIILSGIMVAVNGALLGSYLLLQKNALVSDAISHAVLPGIVIAFMISGQKASFYLLLGAAVSGIVLSQVILWLQTKAKMQKDAAIGLSYTFMFALGLLLMSLFVKDVDLDADCVLFGEIAYVPIDLISIPSIGYIPRAISHLIPSLVLTASVLVFCRKAFFLSTFNPGFSTAIGINTSRWQSVLLAMVAVYTVMAFELVGAIMVVSFMIIPPSTALLFSKKLSTMLWLSSLFGAFSVVVGYALAKSLNISITGTMVVVSGFVLFLCVLLKNAGNKAHGKQQTTG